jgi:plasmid replication initiation protein
MSLENLRIAIGAAAALGLLYAAAARAAVSDYEFKLVDARLTKGQAIAAVRLVRKADGKTVSDAVIFAMRLDMAPDDMESMTSKIEQTQSSEPGVYRFKVDLTDEGQWRISLAAKVQGETGTLQSRLILKATP